MAEKVLEKLEEQLNCSICLDTYTDPKLLQCFHVYCRQCLVPLVDRDQQGQLGLTCPICRQATPIPGRGVAGLQSAFHVNRLLEIRESFQNPAATPEGAAPTDVKPVDEKVGHCFAKSWSCTVRHVESSSVLGVLLKEASTIPTITRHSIKLLRSTRQRLHVSWVQWRSK